MANPIEHQGEWWSQQPDGSWSKWNPTTQGWEAAREEPREAPPEDALEGSQPPLQPPPDGLSRTSHQSTPTPTPTDSSKRWWERKRVLLPATALLSFLLGLGLGGVVAGSETERLEAALTDADQRAEATQLELSEAHDDLASTEDDLDVAIDRADEALEIAQAEAGREISAAKRELRDAKRDLQERIADVAARERKVAQIERSSFGDGIWQVGEDIRPGTYRAPAGGGCYWAVLGSADTSDITNNGGFTANQTVTLSTGWFESQDCGEWQKID